MADPSREDLKAIHAERAEMFRSAWVMRLLRAELPLGETFWFGHVGMQLVFMPIWLLLLVILPIYAPSGNLIYWVVFFALQLMWNLGVSQAVLRVAPASTAAGPWRWVTMVASLALTAQAAGWLVALFTGGGAAG